MRLEYLCCWVYIPENKYYMAGLTPVLLMLYTVLESALMISLLYAFGSPQLNVCPDTV